jgi:hypothetical protein
MGKPDSHAGTKPDENDQQFTHFSETLQHLKAGTENILQHSNLLKGKTNKQTNKQKQTKQTNTYTHTHTHRTGYILKLVQLYI